ncbi:RICIN domain-containing protein [Cystobacter fuscus]|uniref:RICIN domain-containing protein n=1 Tax=Cystobacter fuscus TaxID=43 RepID=UPI000BB3A395|nr:RICIN domain-containing protein [Cystobacter fuscus]
MKSSIWTKAELFRRVVSNSVLLATIGCGGVALDPSELQLLGDEAQLSNSDKPIADLSSIGRIVRLVAQHSWQCLDVLGGSRDPFTELVQYPCHGGDHQRFLIEDLGNGYHTIRAMHSGLCLDVLGGYYEPMTHVVQYPCHGGDHQQFRIEDLGNGYHAIRAKHSLQVLDVAGASHDPLARVVQYPRHGGGNQQFRIE